MVVINCGRVLVLEHHSGFYLQVVMVVVKFPNFAERTSNCSGTIFLAEKRTDVMSDEYKVQEEL